MPGINPDILQESLSAVADRGPELTEFFYGRLFLLAASREQPEVLSMFPLLMDAQRDRLLRALVRIVGTAASGDMNGLTSYLQDTGRDHRMIGSLRPEHFGLVGEALLATLAEYAGDAWTPEAEETWAAAYGLITEVMTKAMEDDGTPRWWEGLVTSARMAAPDVVKLTVQLDQPMTWLPGQSVKAEITLPEDAAPAVRRYLTPVNDPGTAAAWMEFHVKVIPWGLFSPALARYASPGAQLRLSSPAGTLRLREESRLPAVMIAGSTGLAPMMAMIARLGQQRNPPDVALYFGARSPEGLYASRDLDQLAAEHRWLTVTCTVDAPAAHTPGYTGKHGTVVDAALDGDLHGSDVYACGPPAMVRAVRDRLREAGFPGNQLHAESYGLD